MNYIDCLSNLITNIWKGNINFANKNINLGDTIFENLTIPHNKLTFFCFTNSNSSLRATIFGHGELFEGTAIYSGQIYNTETFDLIKVCLEYQCEQKKLILSKNSSIESRNLHILNIFTINMC